MTLKVYNNMFKELISNHDIHYWEITLFHSHAPWEYAPLLIVISTWCQIVFLYPYIYENFHRNSHKELNQLIYTLVHVITFLFPTSSSKPKSKLKNQGSLMNFSTLQEIKVLQSE